MINCGTELPDAYTPSHAVSLAPANPFTRASHSLHTANQPDHATLQMRPYQAAGVDAVMEYLASGETDGLVVWPTGAGKSVLLGEIARRVVASGRRVLVAAHVAELVQQDAAACVRALGPDAVGVYSAGLGQRDTDKAVTVASVQSIYRQPELIGRQDMMLIDEAHLVGHKADGMYRTLLAALRQAGSVPLIGLTATPWRLTTGRLTDSWRNESPLFDQIVHEVAIRDLIETGHLVRPVAKATGSKLTTAGVSKRLGEFAAGELEAAVNVDDINRTVVSEIIERGPDRRSWLVFASGVAHARALCQPMWDADIAAAAIDGDTPRQERAAAIAAFRTGEIRCLIGCNIFTTGFDAPGVDLIALCRPTMSAGLHIQMIGRGTRLSPETGKTDCLVLDFAGNVTRHGPLDLIDGKRETSVDDAKRQNVGLVRECPDCTSLVPISSKKCPDCEYVFPNDPRESTIAAVPETGFLFSDEMQWLEVHSIGASRHTKAGKPDSLRIDYTCEGRLRPVSEWLAFDAQHPVAREIAQKKWRRLDPFGQIPSSTNEAVAESHRLEMPSAVLTRPSEQSPAWLEIVSVSMEEKAV